MPGVEVKSFSSLEAEKFPRAKVESLALGEGAVVRMILEPGWRFTEHVSPMTGTPSCDDPHLLYFESGRMAIVMDDGTEAEAGPGDIVRIEPGHDAWIVGDEDCVCLDFAASVT